MTKFTILPCVQSVVPPEAVQAFETAYANAVDSTEELFASIMEEDVDSKGKTVEFDESEADGGQ